MAPANLLAISPEIREARPDWLGNQRKRIDCGFEWTETDATARAAYLAAMARTAEIRRDAAVARQMFSMGIAMTAHDFRNHLIAIRCVDGDIMYRAGFCRDTITRMMRDPWQTFSVMTEGERAKFWPLVEDYLEAKREQARVFVGAKS